MKSKLWMGIVAFAVLIIVLGALFGPKVIAPSPLTDNLGDYQKSFWQRLISGQAFALLGDIAVSPGQTKTYNFILDFNTACAGVKETIVTWTTTPSIFINVVNTPNSGNTISGAYYGRADITFIAAGSFVVRADYLCYKGGGSEQVTVQVANSCTSTCTSGQTRCYDSNTGRQGCVISNNCGLWGATSYCGSNEECKVLGDQAQCVAKMEDECEQNEIKCAGSYAYLPCKYTGGVWIWSDSSIDLRPINKVCKNNQAFEGNCVKDSDCGTEGDCSSSYQCIAGSVPTSTPTTVAGGQTTTTISGQTTTTVRPGNETSKCQKYEKENSEGKCAFSFDSLWANYKMWLIAAGIIIIFFSMMMSTSGGREKAATVINMGRGGK